MKRSSFFGYMILITGIAVAAMVDALAQDSLLERLSPPHKWGASTNDLCVGLRISNGGGYGSIEHDLCCDIDVRNTSSNRLYIWMPARAAWGAGPPAIIVCSGHCRKQTPLPA
jgi:hypothetical protein